MAQEVAVRMIDQDSAFAKALRTLFKDDDIPDEAIVDVDMEGGGQYQIGDMTWDTEEIVIDVTAYVPGSGTKKHRNTLSPRWLYTQHRRFYSLPELWAALHPEEGS